MPTMNVVYLALPLSIHALTTAVLDIDNVWEQMSPWHKCNASITCDWNFNLRWFCGLHYSICHSVHFQWVCHQWHITSYSWRWQIKVFCKSNTPGREKIL